MYRTFALNFRVSLLNDYFAGDYDLFVDFEDFRKFRSAIKSGQSTNTYTAVCNGKELSLFINGNLEIPFDETQYNLASGRIGIGVSSPQMLPVNVSFESLTVSEP